MPLFTKVVTAGVAALLSIPVFGSSILGNNYPSPILQHVVDIVQGINTYPVASLNAPNWAEGILLAVPVGVAASTSTAGTLAKSTTWYFEVSALDGTGTSTVSAYATGKTDATPATESLELSWAAVQGATGYAIFFSTSTPTSFTQYFLATSTNGNPNGTYTFATSTGSRSGSYIKTDSTAFATKINPLGMSFLNGGGLQVLGQILIGTTTAASSSELEVNGYARAQLSATSTACYSVTAGEMFYNSSNSHEWGCNGTTWIKIF